MARKLKDKWVVEATELKLENERLRDANAKLTADNDKLATMATTARSRADHEWRRRCQTTIVLVVAVGICLIVIAGLVIARFL